ncbi:MAG: hypothetical protein U0271_47670, partial [Polyangiaceae bacterium]
MRLQELPLVQHPCLKRHSTVAPDRQHALRIQNGPFEVSLDLPRPAREELVIALTAAAPPGAFLPALARLFDLTPAECDGLVSQLVRAGLIIEHPDSRPATLRGDYLGWRLIDVYRTTAPSIWGKSPLFDALRTPGNRTVAIGALLEAYYRLRAAAPSAAAVLGRTLTP